MPTEREREYYRSGFMDGVRVGLARGNIGKGYEPIADIEKMRGFDPTYKDKPKRKLSPWNKFVKANSKKPRFRYKSGANKGKLNLKKMGVAFRKTPAGKRKK